MNKNTGEQNNREWNDSSNWTLPIGFYFSKKDTRWLVPRPNQNLGWAFNLGHKKGALALLLSFIVPILMLTLVLLMVTLL